MSDNIVIQLSGTVFGVDLDAQVQVAGAPLSFSLAPAQPIAFDTVWAAINTELESIAGFSLPDLSGGPWQGLLGGSILPTLWISPSGPGAAAAVYLELDFSEPYPTIGGQLGPFTITPSFEVPSLYIGYDQASGSGLTLKAKIVTLNGGSPANNTQVVTYPFPVPAQPSSNAFQINYIGLGQRVGPTVDVTANDPLAAIFTQLESELKGNNPSQILTELATNFYNPDRDWFVAADVSLRGFELRILFNDPVLYGLEVTVASSPPTFFSGLLFEILYQKLGPNLGVYYGALTLPMAMRRIVLDGVILILPGFQIWIYTNGDFRVNVGWPLGSNSIGVQAGPLIGAGGFYFAKLSSGDNPGAQPSVDYNPILAFGLGATLYVNQSFNASIFSASISVSLTATFQGLLAWESGNSISGPPDHYWFAGTAGLSVLLQGTVDFAIIKASVTVSFTANASVAFETGYLTLVTVSASVSVEVSIHIIFFTIHFSFQTSVSTQFTIGSGTVPASINGPLAPGLSIVGSGGDAVHAEALAAARSMIERMSAREKRGVGAASLRLDAYSRAVSAAPQIVDLLFVLQPTVVYGDATPLYNAIASLVIESPAPGSASPPQASNFGQLITAMVNWLLSMATPVTPLSEQFAEVVTQLGSGSESPFGDWNLFVASLDTFLENALSFNITGAGSGSPDSGIETAAVFPMLDALQLEYVDQSGAAQTIDFNTFNPTPSQYPLAVTDYFTVSIWSGSPVSPVSSVFESDSPQDGLSMASFAMADWFLMQARNAANALLSAAQAYEQQVTQSFLGRIDAVHSAPAAHWDRADILASYVSEITGSQELDTLLAQFDYASAAGIGSRFMLNGLQLPIPADVPAFPTVENMKGVPAAGLYTLTGQQFAAGAGETQASATLTLSSSFSPPPDWIAFGSPGSTTSTIDLPATVPPTPAPLWQTGGSPPGSGGAAFAALPPLSAHPLYVSLKNQIAWSSAGAAQTILPLPPPVQLLAGDVQVQITSAPPPSTNGSPSSPAGSPIVSTAALLIKVTLAQVPANSNVNIAAGSPSGSSPAPAATPQYLPHVYQMSGTDEATRDLIQKAITSDMSSATIALLYPDTGGTSPGSAGMVSQPLSPNVLLTKTNLSTLNQVGEVVMSFAAIAGNSPEDVPMAAVGDVAGFLQLLWELSVVNAPGFFLFYETADGQDLPAGLFASPGVQGGGTTAFEILVQFEADPSAVTAIPAYANLVFIDVASPQDALYAEVIGSGEQPALQWFPTYPAGNVGFTVQWDIPPSSPNDPVPVDSLYHLLQYQVQGSGSYNESIWSLPVTPTQNSGSPSSSPLFTYLSNVSAYLYLADSPAEVPSPYGIVGTTLNLALRVADVYGDVLPASYTATFAPLYQDSLISIGEWPGVHVAYVFLPASGSSAALEITVTFDPESIAPSGGSPGFDLQQQWETALARYDLILFQLADPNVSVQVTTSVAGGAVGDSTDIIGALYELAVAIRDEIAAAISSPSGAETVSRVIPFDVPFAAVAAQGIDIISVGVGMTFSRDAALVDPLAVANMPSAVSVSYDIPADLTGDAASPNVALFASNFEAAFDGFDGASGMLKLAQRSGSGSATPVSDSFWAVRWSAGSGVSVSAGDDLVYFALQPLSTTPISGVAAGKTWSGVDLDAWAEMFLAAFDSFLNPQTAVAVSILDLQDGTTAYQTLCDIKSQLSVAVPQGLTTLFVSQTNQGSLADAQERLGEAMLTQLSSAFSVTTVVQVPVSVTVSGATESPGVSTEAPQLYGAVATSTSGAAAQSTYSFSPGEVVLSTGDQWMTTLLTVVQPGEQSALDIGLTYQVSYLQHDFRGDEDAFGYTPSSWLKFVLPAVPPLTIPIVSSAAIPIPLIFEPSVPVLLGASASATQPATPASPGNIEAEIADLLEWNYTATLALALESQDQLFFDFTYNFAPSLGSNAARLSVETDPVMTLFAALAEFRQWYGASSPDFGQIVAAALPGSGSPGGSPGAARALIDGFVSAAQAVATAWAGLSKEADVFLGLEQPLIDSFYLTVEQDTVSLFGRTASGGNPEYWPALTFASGLSWTPDGGSAVPNGSGGDAWFMLSQTFPASPAIDTSTIEVTVGPLDMLSRQTALLTSWVVRNASLVSGETTAEEFVYTTPQAAFASPLIPLIHRAQVPTLLPAATLADTLEQILIPIAQPGALLGTVIRIAVSYAYDVAVQPTGSALSASTAVMLVDDIEIGASPGDAQSLAELMAVQLGTWFVNAQLPSGGALLVLAVTLFAKAEQLPLVQIDEIPIDVSNVGAEWWGGGA